MGKAAIVVHERKQFCACLVNRLQTDAEIFFLWGIGAGSKPALPVHVLFQFLQQCFAQRGNRCDSIHDFVGQNTDELDPGVNLLVAQLVAHIADGDDAHWLVFDHGSGLMLGEMLILQLLPYLVEMGEHIGIEEAEGGLVMLQHIVVTIHHHDASIHHVQYLLVIFLTLHLLLPGMLQESLDAVEGLVQDAVVLRYALHRKIKGEIHIVDGIKKENHLLDVTTIVAIKTDVACYRYHQQKNYND